MTSIGFPQQFNKDVASIVALFLCSEPYKFWHWIDPEKLNWAILCKTLHESTLRKHLNRVNWYWLSYNPNATSLLRSQIESPQNIGKDEIDWFVLSTNPGAISILEKHYNKINWAGMCANKNGIHLLNQYTNNFTTNLDSLSWSLLSKNKNAIDIIRKHFHRIDFLMLCSNANAIPLIKEITNNFTRTLERSHWNALCENPNAMDVINELIQTKSQNISWDAIARNPNTIQLIEQNMNKINLKYLCLNPNAIHLLSKWDQQYNHLFEGSYYPIPYGSLFFWNELSFNKNLTYFDQSLYNTLLSALTKIVYHL